MKVKLSLSVVSSRPSDILILDEVFSGADHLFSKKISDRIFNIIQNSGIVIFVSHSVEHIRRVCNRVILLDQGKIIYDGAVNEGLELLVGTSKSPSLSQEEMQIIQERKLEEIKLRLRLSEESAHSEKKRNDGLVVLTASLETENENLKQQVSSLKILTSKIEETKRALEAETFKFRQEHQDLQNQTKTLIEQLSEVEKKVVINKKSTILRAAADELIRVHTKFFRYANNVLPKSEEIKRLLVRRSPINLHAEPVPLLQTIIKNEIPACSDQKTFLDFPTNFIVRVIIDKFEHDLSVNLQSHMMKEAGHDISPALLYDLCTSTAQQFIPLYNKIKEDICNDFCAVQIDHVAWTIPNKQIDGKLWVLCNRIGTYFELEHNSSSNFLVDLGQHHLGSFVCETIREQNSLKKASGSRVQLCWHYVKRELNELQDLKQETIDEPLNLINMLFELEVSTASTSELAKIRNKESRDLTNKFKEWCEHTINNPPNSNSLSLIARNCIESWAGLTHFLEDISVPISTKNSEMALYYAIVERRHLMKSHTLIGAKTRAVVYTILETCRQNGLDPKSYLTYILTEQFHGRTPQTPIQMAIDQFGENKKRLSPLTID